MKNPKIVVYLLVVAGVCIEALEAQAQPSKKQQQEDREVNTMDCGDRRNHGNH
jgi:hypothetical protein